MAKRLAIPSEDLRVTIVGPYNEYDVARAQRYNVNTDVPTTDIYELGNNQLAGTAQDTPNVTLTLSVFDVGIRAFSVLTGTDPASYPGAGVDISDLQEVDVIAYIKDAEVSDFVKSAHARRLQVRDFSFNYSVDGESTEDYTLIGSENRWFKNDVQVDRFTVGTTSFTLTETPIQLSNGNNGLSVILDGEYLVEVSTAPATGEYRIVGTTLTTANSRTEQVLAVYHANPAGTNWAYISEQDVPAAIRGRNVDVVISVEDIPRVQSVTINGNLNVQPVSEMGSTTIIGYQRQVPSVDGNIVVLDTDTELLDLLLNNSTDSGETEFQIGVDCLVSGVPLDIILKDPCDPDTTLKTVYIPELVLTGDSYTGNINQNAAHTLNWKSNTAQCLVYSGSR